MAKVHCGLVTVHDGIGTVHVVLNQIQYVLIPTAHEHESHFKIVMCGGTNCIDVEMQYLEEVLDALHNFFD